MIKFLKSLFQGPSAKAYYEPSPEQIETIKSKIKKALVEVGRKSREGEIFKDQGFSLARKKINKSLTAEERKIVGKIKIGYTRLGDLAANFRGESVTSFDPNAGIEKEKFRRIIQEEVSQEI